MKNVLFFFICFFSGAVALGQSEEIPKSLCVEIKLDRDFRDLEFFGIESFAYPEILELRGYGSEENHPGSIPDLSITMVRTEMDCYVPCVTYHGPGESWTQEISDYPSWWPDFVMFDINGDGFKDLGMIWSAASNRGIDFRGWNPQKFSFDDSEMNLCNPLYSEKKNLVYCYEHMNAAECMETVYEISGGKLNQLFSLYTIYSDEGHVKFIFVESEETETVVEVTAELSAEEIKEKQKQIKNLNRKIAGYLK